MCEIVAFEFETDCIQSFANWRIL